VLPAPPLPLPALPTPLPPPDPDGAGEPPPDEQARPIEPMTNDADKLKATRNFGMRFFL
jgi:hypothetical protein